MIRSIIAATALAVVSLGVSTAPASAVTDKSMPSTTCSNETLTGPIEGNVFVTGDCTLQGVTVTGNIIAMAGTQNLTILGESSAHELITRAHFNGDLIVGVCGFDPTFENVLVQNANDVLLCEVNAKKIDILKADGRVTVRDGSADRIQFKDLRAYAGTSAHQNAGKVRVISVLNTVTGMNYVDGDTNLQFLNNDPSRTLGVR